MSTLIHACSAQGRMGHTQLPLGSIRSSRFLKQRGQTVIIDLDETILHRRYFSRPNIFWMPFHCWIRTILDTLKLYFWVTFDCGVPATDSVPCLKEISKKYDVVCIYTSRWSSYVPEMYCRLG